jgi:hypothetical protein
MWTRRRSDPPFSFPPIVARRPGGGRFVEMYLNYQYNLFMGALATLTDPPFIFGGLWMTRRASLERTGMVQGLEDRD